VLVVGGIGSDGILANAELFDPATGKWTTMGALNTARVLHTAALLPNGRVLIAGGNDNNSSRNLSSAELFDPAR
jgi:N-acetylneuraminic acid mutarotase